MVKSESASIIRLGRLNTYRLNAQNCHYLKWLKCPVNHTYEVKMSNKELAKRIASDLFTGSGDTGTKAKHLRMYTDFGEDGRYLAGWSESGMAYRIEYLLDEAGIATPPPAPADGAKEKE